VLFAKWHTALVMLFISCSHTPTAGKPVNSEETKLCTVIITLLTKQVNFLDKQTDLSISSHIILNEKLTH